MYRASYSTNVERVALALAHKGLEAEPVWISYEDRSEVERVSGQPLVPVLDDDGRIVVDSMEIVRHLERRNPEPPLYPSDRSRRAEMLVFIDWFNRVWKSAPNAIEAELGRPRPDRDRIDALSGEMRAHLDLFEAMLARREHLFGDFSAADIAAFPFVKYALGREAADDELFHRLLEEHQTLGPGHTRLAAWIRRVDERPRA